MSPDDQRPPRKEPRENLFSTMLNAMTDGVLVVDDRLRVVVTNRALREMLLLPPTASDRPLSKVFQEPRLVDAFRQVLQGGTAQSLEHEHRGLQNRVLDVLVLPLPDHEYWGHRALGVVRDVTQQRDVERMHREFIANASHELRTPTAAILGYAETLVDAPPRDPATLRKFHETVHRHAQRLSTLLEQLLDVGRLDAGTYQLHIEAVAVEPLVRRTVEQMGEAARQAGLSVSVTAQGDLPPVRADAGALEVVVGNLLQNAIKYTPSGGRVEVRLRADATGPSLRLQVVDSGIGIAAEDQARIFERFYRVDKGRSRQVGGAGLGLAIVKTLVDEMGGRLEVASRMGHGSTFTVTLGTATSTG